MKTTLGEIGDVIGDRVTDKLFSPYDLRDWFAGMALQGMVAGLFSDQYQLAPVSECAEGAYQYADAMIAERMKK